ncbi:ABC1 kinase family protein [Paracoccus spongiarum]|uniref:AarF/ABC1/UbiB kinase family protein n=1 Tax=Paracoccus spongiarum TaxID=3064387 RepID=A0ABT9JEB6_9RHOB|nr:AarF/ABC1/UbiB kinase family protein [Paracoccus sp. 2205BS29-5]MDP5308166.1 AarF/ABC1/UbiB kinase family protein [Paracoccus sp. 2205BS29-5]
MTEDERDAHPVPVGRIARIARLGGMAAGIAGRAAIGGAGMLAQGRRPSARDLLLTPANAARLTRQLSQMRGAAMKLGQLMSMEAGDLLPPDLAQVMARLRDQASHMPPGQLKQVLAAAYGADFVHRFRRFQTRPVAAASIGQVHRATALDGRDLAIKLQYPGIAASIDSDLANVAALIRMSGLLPRGFDLAPLIDEARGQLRAEADYAQEARAMSRFADLLAGDDGFAVPRPAADLCAPGVLAMDFMAGEPVETLAGAPQALRDRLAERLIALTLREIFAFGLLQSDPNFANFRWNGANGRIVLLDFGAVREVPGALVGRLRALLGAGLAEGQGLGGGPDLAEAAGAAGYLDPAMSAADRDRLLDMMRLAFAPFRTAEPFDFAASNLPAQLRDMTLVHARDRDGVHLPPIDLIFVQRKVAGLFLLGARLRARVALAPLVAPHAA